MSTNAVNQKLSEHEHEQALKRNNNVATSGLSFPIHQMYNPETIIVDQQQYIWYWTW